MEHSRCVVAGSPHSAFAVLAVHMWPTFDAGIRAETGCKKTLMGELINDNHQGTNIIRQISCYMYKKS